MKENIRLIPEWNKQDAVLLAWPHADTDWCEILGETDKCYYEIAKAITSQEHLIILTPEPERIKKLTSDISNPERLHIKRFDTNDTWIRDYGPLSFESANNEKYIADFTFNGWGMKFAADKDNLICRCLFLARAFNNDISYLNRLSVVLEGGSVESDGEGTILTTKHCLFEANRNAGISPEDLLPMLEKLLGANRLLILENGLLDGDDTDGHVDTLARFLDAETIVYTSCENPNDHHFEELRQMELELSKLTTATGKPYKLQPLPLPTACYAADGHRLPATYANFLIINNAILLPIYGVPQDEVAIARMRSITDREIIPINCRVLIEQHGSLHCATMQIPEAFINPIYLQ